LTFKSGCAPRRRRRGWVTGQPAYVEERHGAPPDALRLPAPRLPRSARRVK